MPVHNEQIQRSIYNIFGMIVMATRLILMIIFMQYLYDFELKLICMACLQNISWFNVK